jgi:hypothetical protein
MSNNKNKGAETMFTLKMGAAATFLRKIGNRLPVYTAS